MSGGDGVLVVISGVVLAVSVSIQISVVSVSGSIVLHVAKAVTRISRLSISLGSSNHSGEQE